MAFVQNRPLSERPSINPDVRHLLGSAAPNQVRPYLRLWPEFKATPTYRMSALSTELGLDSIFIKDEGTRLGLGSFKALGGAYAVMRLVHRHIERTLGRRVTVEDLLTPTSREIASSITVGCATDGNHGRSVAAGARLMGCRSVIFLHQGVSSARAISIGDVADEIIRVDGSYDDSVDEALRICNDRGWLVVSDTSWPGYEETPTIVSQGYSILAEEALDQIREQAGTSPTHVFLQAGVGGFAAALACYMTDRLGSRSPQFIIVEPDHVACILESFRRGELARLPQGEPTIMAMLECYQPSLVAWRILQSCASAFQSIPDEAAAEAMRILARPKGHDNSITAGESGAAGLAGLLMAARDKSIRDALRLGPESTVLLINTETATDPAAYKEIVGEVATETLAK